MLRLGCGLEDLHRDLIAGLTVAIVALPLAMALAIASGATPDKGLHTAIIAGFLISALGGSRVQVGGPTAAFIPVVFSVMLLLTFALTVMVDLKVAIEGGLILASFLFMHRMSECVWYR